MTNNNKSEQTTRSFWGQILGYSVVGIFLILCGYYIYSHRADFAFVSKVSFSDLMIAGLLVLVTLYVSALQLRLFLGEFGVRLAFMRLMALTMSMILGNLVLPMRGGTGIIAVYLKKIHGLDLTAFAVIYAGTGLLVALVNTGLALIGLLVMFFSHKFFYPPLVLSVAFLFGVFCYISIFPPPIKWKRGGILRVIFDGVNSWHSLTRHRLLLMKLTLLFLIVSLCLAGALYFIYRALGDPLSAFAVLITSALGNLANLAPIVPGSFGIFDAITIKIPMIFGLDTARAVTATLLFRVIFFFWALTLGIPGLLYLFTFIRERKVR
jgi:uncharacterized membrane protein YbhN (UPF0104 family)